MSEKLYFIENSFNYRNIFDCLIKFHAASHISSVNLIACTGTLCTIAKLRPSLMQPVIDALFRLNSNLPPTLTDSQISSVRKHLKMQLLNILRQPGSYEHQSTVIQILSDLGASHQEIGRSIPRLSKQEQQKRAKRALENPSLSNVAKKFKPDETTKVVVKPIEMEVDADEVADQIFKANKINSEFLMEQLKKPENAISLVVEFMPNLPVAAPQPFLDTYKPFASMSHEEQIQKTANLLAEQMTEKKCGPGSSCITKEQPMRVKISTEEEKSIVHGMRDEPEDEEIDPGKDEEKRKDEAIKKLRDHLERVKGEQQLIPKLKQRVKTLKLQEITKPLSKQLKEKFLIDAVKRILRAEKACFNGGVSQIYRKILIALGSSPTSNIREMILEFIFQDSKTQMDFAFSWLYEEYSILQGFTRHSYVKSESKKNDNYNRLFLDLVQNIIKFTDEKDRMTLIRKIYLGAPLLTDGSVKLLVEISEMTELNGMDLIRELLILRPPKRKDLLENLLNFSVHNNSTVREMAIDNLLKIYKERIMMDKIEEFSLKWLRFLEMGKPGPELFHQDFGREECFEVWTEDLAKVCVGLFLAILPDNEKLVHTLCLIYTATTSDMKRTILRAIELPIRKMGGDCLELLNLIETCPKGAETLITRIAYILTEKSPPTMDLVNAVRELYQNKVSDVRFLIPVLCCLTKQEILNALPRFLKLNEAVVKDVFKRLLGIGQEYVVNPMPITPSELLVVLHKIDPAKVELKFIMQATRLCLTEKDTYTHDVLAVVLQQLVEITPLPTLLMRTVIQSLTLYPRLAGFVSNLLQRLILKQVWKQKVVWEGFLKCSQRLVPQSLPVLIQLPSMQLQDALNVCPELREPLIQHCQTLIEVGGTSQQVMDILLGKITLEEKKDGDETMVVVRPDPSQPLPPGEE